MDEKYVMFFVVFCVFLMVGVTPACAMNIEEMQQDAKYLNDYAHKGAWYKFVHLGTAIKTSYNLMKDLNEAKNELQSEKAQLEAEKKALEKEENEEKSDNTELLEYYNAKKDNTKNDNTTEDNQISKTANNGQSKEIHIPKRLKNNAKDVQKTLKNENISVEIATVDLKHLTPGTIVQVIRELEGHDYVRYYTYLDSNDNGVKLFDGKKEVAYGIYDFRSAYTGLTFKNTGASDVNTITKKIYQNKLEELYLKIEKLKQKRENLSTATLTFAFMTMTMFTLTLISLCIVMGPVSAGIFVLLAFITTVLLLIAVILGVVYTINDNKLNALILEWNDLIN